MATKSSINVSDLPKFHGRNYQQRSDKMMGFFMVTKTTPIIDGSLTKPTGTEPTEPSAPPANSDANVWTIWTAKFTCYQTKLDAHKKALSHWNDMNMTTMGIFNMCLDIRIWDQIKDKTALETWVWLKEKYGKEAFVEVLEDFRYIRNLRFDLSDPNPQLANFIHHYQ